LIGAHRRLPALAHGFTHYALTIRSALCEVEKVQPRAHSPGAVWLPLQEALQASIPAPVRKLLMGIGDSEAGTAKKQSR